MTIGNGGTKVTIPDNLIKVVGLTIAVLGAGYSVARKVNSFESNQQRLEQRFNAFIFDLCSHTPPEQRVTYISCNSPPVVSQDGLQAQEAP